MASECKKIERQLDRRIRESNHKDPAEETDQKLDHEIKNLRFKAKYLMQKIADERSEIDRLNSQRN